MSRVRVSVQLPSPVERLTLQFRENQFGEMDITSTILEEFTNLSFSYRSFPTESVAVTFINPVRVPEPAKNMAEIVAHTPLEKEVGMKRV